MSDSSQNIVSLCYVNWLPSRIVCSLGKVVLYVMLLITLSKHLQAHGCLKILLDMDVKNATEDYALQVGYHTQIIC